MILLTHVRIQKVLSEGANSENGFLVDEGRREDPNNTLDDGLVALCFSRGFGPYHTFYDI